MKIVRCMTRSGISYCVVENEIVKQIKGTPYGEFTFTGHEFKLSDVRLLAPAEPSKILAMALNYRSHLHDAPAPTKPEPFLKAPSCIIGPGEFIVLPRGSTRVDEEGELVAVIGKKCSKVSKASALNYVLGYTCGNDISARDWQKGDIQWWRAKSSDTFGSVGPWVVTDLDPSGVAIEASVNGKPVQQCNTKDLLFDVPTLISFISQVVTLTPGDLIYTGTSGVPAQIKDGDTVDIEIGGIGILSNPVKTER